LAGKRLPFWVMACTPLAVLLYTAVKSIFQFVNWQACIEQRPTTRPGISGGQIFKSILDLWRDNNSN
jgi:hypothetical protein